MIVQRFELATLSPDARRRLLRRSEREIHRELEAARAILDAVRERGDAALIELTERFDGVRLTPAAMKLDRAEIAERAEALRRVHPALDEAIRVAARQIEAFHRAQLPKPVWWTEVSPGVFAGERVTPIPDVAVYVPRGKGSFPSVLLMLAVPARVAGVPRRIVLTPPAPGGGLDPAVVLAADHAGVDAVYTVGGAQAIAAVAFGTETVPKMHKVIGPGNAYVTAAKRLLVGTIDIGILAGPSEAIVLADGSADPERVARDWLNEAEHGPDSAALLVTDDGALLEAAESALRRLLGRLPEGRRRFAEAVFRTYGGGVIARSMDEAIAFVNDYAPEHLVLHVRDPHALLWRLEHAGEILLGPWTPIALGNFVVGTNAILPTGGHAKTTSAVSVWDFLKRTSLAWATEAGYRRLRPYARLLAEVEGFPAHALALEDEEAAGAARPGEPAVGPVEEESAADGNRRG
ncbi:MAG: histidinol dehydrogenase [Hydrogenibacillus schlegelii]|nr:histidinol dehydrogenase [Hydrogenibacillus schlegelii]